MIISFEEEMNITPLTIASADIHNMKIDIPDEKSIDSMSLRELLIVVKKEIEKHKSQPNKIIITDGYYILKLLEKIEMLAKQTIDSMWEISKTPQKPNPPQTSEWRGATDDNSSDITTFTTTNNIVENTNYTSMGWPNLAIEEDLDDD